MRPEIIQSIPTRSAAVAGVVTGVALTAALILIPMPANAGSIDGRNDAALAGVTPNASVHVLSGTLEMRAEQRQRSGGSGRSSGGSSGGQAVPRGGSGSSGGSSGGNSGGTRSGGATTREGSSGGGDARTRGDSGGSSGGNAQSTPPNSRPRDGRTSTGTAVQRRDGGGRGDTTIIVGGGYYPGFYPWGWGGLGLGGYYGWYDPWGWYDPYPPAGGYGYYADGALKLKVKPRQAEVFVDGYFAGAVDDYDGAFQRLRLEPGPHRIEIRLDGYEPLSFEIRIQPDRTVTYKGELQKISADN